MIAKRGALLALRGCLLAAVSLLGLAVPAARAQTPPVQGTTTAADEGDADNTPSPAPASRPFFISGGLSLSELYDSNITGLPQGTSGTTTQGELAVRAHDESARFTGDLSYSLFGNYHPENPSLSTVQNYLNAIGHAELLPEQLYLSARAFATPTFLSRLGPLDAGSGTSASANDRNAYGYQVSPDFLMHFDGFAQSDLTLMQVGEFFSNLANSPPPGQALPFFFPNPNSVEATTLTERLTSGENFGRLKWTLIASGTDSAEGFFHQREKFGDVDLEYHLDRNFALIGDVGYHKYASRPVLNHNLSGLTEMAGFTYQLDNSFQFTAEAGRRYNFTSYTGNMAWQITAESALTATLDDTVGTPQDRLLSGLNGLSADADGFSLGGSKLPDQALLTGLIPSSSAPVGLSPADGLALDNAMSRYRTATGGLIHKMPRWTYSLTLYGTIRDYLLPVSVALDTRQTIYGGDLSVIHELSRELSASVRADYSVAREFGGLDKITTVNLGLTYLLAAQWTVYGSGNYISRNTRNFTFLPAGNTTDLQLGAGLRYNF